MYYCNICQRTGVVTSILQYNINCQILVSLQNICVSDTLKLDPKTINETPLPSPFDHNTAVIVTLDDSRGIRIVSRGLLGMHLEWQEDGKRYWFIGSVVIFRKCSTALWVAAVYNVITTDFQYVEGKRNNSTNRRIG